MAELLTSLPPIRGWLCLEYEIARRGRRIDAVLILERTIVVLEFKSSVMLDSANSWQVREYALDLRDFHGASSRISIVPVLVSTAESPANLDAATSRLSIDRPGVYDVVQCVSADLVHVIRQVALCGQHRLEDHIDPIGWRDAPYRPSLNIIEAAERVFTGQEVREISHATAENLSGTVDCVVEAVRSAQRESRRVVCFLTGVPGAGKTLAGLSAVHNPVLRQNNRPAAVFLSGNGPLVRIVRSALVRDLRRRNCRTKDSGRQVSTFIQNVHNFLGHYALKSPDEVPPENVVVFDEAQRAWDREQMQLKKRGNKSEAELMLDIMTRCSDWAVIVALIGFGQEIHQGEAGLAEWGTALQGRSEAWSVVASPLVLDQKSERSVRLFDGEQHAALSVRPEPKLHLATSIRSHRARLLSEWVQAVLNCDALAAKALFADSKDFPISYTRDLTIGRQWLRAHSADAPNSGDCGLVASSGAVRLRAYGLEGSSGFRRGFPFEDWFLAGPSDVRSSSMLEVAASEFECQGLELDWVGVCWGGDLTFDAKSGTWLARRFAGSRYLSVNNPTTRRFLLNKYRVLLTRARRGMVIWIPCGSSTDKTLEATHFDATAEFLESCGVPRVSHG